MGKLDDKVALITGGGGGIGSATARLMAEACARIAVTGVPEEQVAAVAAELVADGHEAITTVTDVSKADQVEAAVASAVSEFGSLDILVPNVGIQLHDRDIGLHDLSEEVWDATMDVNLRGIYLACRFGLKQMLAQGTGGAIVIVSSITALSGVSENFTYVTSKGVLLALSRNIALTYAKDGIRCNAVCPGALERTPNHELHLRPEARAAMLKETVRLGRTGPPEEIAPMITFLASEDASYATAGTFIVDGGRTMI